MLLRRRSRRGLRSSHCNWTIQPRGERESRMCILPGGFRQRWWWRAGGIGCITKPTDPIWGNYFYFNEMALKGYNVIVLTVFFEILVGIGPFNSCQIITTRTWPECAKTCFK